MKFSLSEYNVTPNLEERDAFSISLNDDLKYNGQVVGDETKKAAAIEALEKYKSDIIRLSAEPAENYKGGRQKGLVVLFDGDEKKYRLIGNTDLKEMANLYNQIKTELTQIFA